MTESQGWSLLHAHSAKTTMIKPPPTRAAPPKSYSTQVLICPIAEELDPPESRKETAAPGCDSYAEEGPSHTHHTGGLPKTVFKVLGGLLLVLCVSSSWVGTTQLVQLTYKSFPCPFFISWFCCNWNILFFPLYYSGYMTTPQERQKLIKKFRDCHCVFGSEQGTKLKMFVKRTAPFSILWTLTNYLHLLALHKLTATDVSALYCCHKAFEFLLSWMILKDRFMGIRIVAAIMSIIGIVIMAYADGLRTDSILGVTLAVCSACTLALYKVLLKKFLDNGRLGEAAHLFSTMGLFNFLFVSGVPLVLFLTHVEHWSSAALTSPPWGYLCGIASLWLVFNISASVGIFFTYPILISIGTLLSVPGNVAVDVLKHEVTFSVVRLVATCCICLGFLLMLLPEQWDSLMLSCLAALAEDKTNTTNRPPTTTTTHGHELKERNVVHICDSKANGDVPNAIT
ncbi:solute carrier family 35 member F4 [Engraulis encrasicolus]|uniref:solute carrier family 35 member F4 n=1 Tax=Engraulis encrasicolus TaxID=184585 RepID=UPI002FD60EC9